MGNKKVKFLDSETQELQNVLKEELPDNLTEQQKEEINKEVKKELQKIWQKDLKDIKKIESDIENGFHDRINDVEKLPDIFIGIDNLQEKINSIQDKASADRKKATESDIKKVEERLSAIEEECTKRIRDLQSPSMTSSTKKMR